MKTGETRNPGDPDPRTLVERVIRVDQAGEFGAVRIYDGQLAALRWTGRANGDTGRRIAAMPATVSLIIGLACSHGGFGKTSARAGGTTFTGIRASLSRLRATRTRSCPSAANSRANSSPMPPDAPVTSAVIFCRSLISGR